MHFKSFCGFILFPVVSGGIHESLGAIPRGWELSSEEISEDYLMNLRVSLQYRNIDSLQTKVKAVSDPESSSYGEYLDIENLHELFAPATNHESTVRHWLESEGVQSIQSDGYTISFITTIRQANSMLKTNFALYTNGKTTVLRTTQYSIPDDLGDAVDIVSPTTYFGSVQKESPASRAKLRATRSETLPPTKRQFSRSCETTVHIPSKFVLVTPECIRELYNVGDYHPDANSGSTIAFGSFLNQTASQPDLAEFEKKLGLPAHNFTTLALINGAKDGEKTQTLIFNEANLDVQTIAGLVGSLPIGEYVTGGVPPIIPDPITTNKNGNVNEPYLQYFRYLLAQSNADLPYVISNSYFDHEDTVPDKYAARVCNMIGMLGLRGRTILFCSGDEGVGAVCRSNRGAMEVQFSPQFPASCPYVTSVGGTHHTQPECAWFASSGGFSNYFSAPWYQRDAVSTYLQSQITEEAKKYYLSNNYVNFSGRAFPDVSAHSTDPDYFGIYGTGEIAPNGGTSASAPVVAGIIALLNDARFRAGKPAMGFINPWLYRNAAQTIFHDITCGNSIGCNGFDSQTGEKVPHGGIIPYASWNATEGWDPVTGLGTPNFEKMKEIALQG